MEDEGVAVPEGAWCRQGRFPTFQREAESLGLGWELERFCELDLKRSVLELLRLARGVVSSQGRKGGL